MQVAITLERPNKSYVSTGVYLLLEAAKGESNAVVTQFLITCIGPGDAGSYKSTSETGHVHPRNVYIHTIHTYMYRYCDLPCSISHLKVPLLISGKSKSFLLLR